MTDNGDSVLSAVCARDLVAALSPQLEPPEKAVLDCLADGLGPREIGRRLNISHTMVIRHRCKIASLLNRLGRSQNFGRSIPGAGNLPFINQKTPAPVFSLA
jgi:DNA-binding NarL/FixJ family response regulator